MNPIEDNLIREEAFRIYQMRIQQGLQGTAEQDWEAAEKVIRAKLGRKVKLPKKPGNHYERGVRYQQDREKEKAQRVKKKTKAST